jgi:hypothetical protein
MESHPMRRLSLWKQVLVVAGLAALVTVCALIFSERSSSRPIAPVKPVAMEEPGRSQSDMLGELQTVGTSLIQKGQDIETLHSKMTDNGLHLIVSSRSGGRSVFYYGYGGLGDPVLIVEFRQRHDLKSSTPKFMTKVDKWRVEE